MVCFDNLAKKVAAQLFANLPQELRNEWEDQTFTEREAMETEWKDILTDMCNDCYGLGLEGRSDDMGEYPEVQDTNTETEIRDALVELFEVMDGFMEGHIAEAEAKTIKTLSEKAHIAEMVSKRLGLKGTALKLRELKFGGEKE